MRITVNGKETEWVGHTIDYGNVLAIAQQPAGATVTYVGKRNGDSQRAGTLHSQSHAIVVDDGMSFTAGRTGNA